MHQLNTNKELEKLSLNKITTVRSTAKLTSSLKAQETEEDY